MGRVLISLLFWMLVLHAAAQGQSKRITVPYTAVSATQSAFYLAKEGGYFEKHGLLVDPVYVAGGARVAQAMVAGEFGLALAGGVIIDANVAGGDIVVIGGIVNVPPFYVMVHPSIKKPEDLRGKAIGITRYGSSTDFTIRYLIKKWGMEPDKDIKVLQMGGQQEILAGLQAGVIQGGNLSSPADFKARQAGFELLVDFKTVGLDYPTVNLVATRSFIKKEPGTVRSFLMAYSEAVERLFSDKKLATAVIGKYTRTEDREALDAGYAFATNFIERPPGLPYKAFRTILAQTAEKVPKAKSFKAEDFIDASFHDELDRSGFFKSLGR